MPVNPFGGKTQYFEFGRDAALQTERLIKAVERSGDISQVLTAINNLDRKVSELMSTQEERLRAVNTKLQAIQTGVDTIQQQLADLKAGNPELEDEISAIEATAGAIDTDVNPAVEPTPEA